MDRRLFLLFMANAALAPTLLLADAGTEEWLTDLVPGGGEMRHPETVGSLSKEEFTVLHDLFQRIGAHWEMPLDPAGMQVTLETLITNKTTLKPSYLTEYREALSILERLHQSGMSNTQALDRLLEPMEIAEAYAYTRIGHAQKFVSAEFIAFHMSQGGFRKFGYKNYRGFYGGQFIGTEPPYRGA
jgi:hypothetical protein